MTSTQQPKRGLQGEARPPDFAGEYNALLFVIKQIINRTHVSALCKVIAVTGGGVANVGYVDLQPLLNQVDGYGDAIPQGILYNVPYFRLQSGNNAIIIDPQVGDIGISLFSDRDITAIKFQYNAGNRAQVLATGVNPATRRRFADGLFFGGFFNGTPTQYLQFLTNVINLIGTGTLNVTETTAINLTAPVINLSSWAGMIAAFGMGTVPGGWLACPTVQTLVSTTTYARLFSALGYTWGGSGSSFGIPFFPTGYVPVVGAAGVLTHGVIINHVHPNTLTNVSAGWNLTGGGGSFFTGPTNSSNPTGGGVDNLAAGYGVQYCVKY